MNALGNSGRTLRRDIGSPLHHQLFSILRSAIVSGQYSQGDLLPGENALMEIYDLSRATVRRALLSLAAEGLIERHPGIGTRVVQAPMRVDMAFSTAEFDALDTRVRIIESVLVPGSAEVCSRLALPPGSLVLRNTRLRVTKNGVPLRLLISFIPEALSKDLCFDNIGGATMVELLNRAGHVAASATDIIGATLADPSVATHLNAKVGAPLVQVDRLAIDLNKKPILHQINLFSPENQRIKIDVRANADGLPQAGAPGYLF